MTEFEDEGSLLVKKNPNKFNKINSKKNQISKYQVLDKTCMDVLLCFCQNNDLTIEEYESYISLRKECSIPFDSKNESHESALSKYFTDIKKLIESSIQSPSYYSSFSNSKDQNSQNEKIWRTAGFQSGNPRNDFRAGGFFSLQFMQYFVDNYSFETKKMICQPFFSFSLTCINLSYLMRLFLYLSTIEDISACFKSSRMVGCSRKELKNFANHLLDNQYLFFVILSYCLEFVYKKYVREFRVGLKEANYYLIDPIILVTIKCLAESLDIVKSYDDLLQIFKIKLENEIDKKL